MIPKGIELTVKKVMGKNLYTINDFDLDRIYLSSNNEEYTIRLWNVTNYFVEWTLFKDMYNNDGTGYGEKIKNGKYYYKKDLDK
jgi:hypothetical protein